MTYIPQFVKSSIKCDILHSKTGTAISGTVTAHFDKTQLSNTDISSTNDYQFTLDHTSNSSFYLTGGMMIDNTNTSAATITYQWYDETNSQFIGSKGFMSNVVNPAQTNPWYSTEASCIILSSSFSSANIIVSLRAVETTGSATYPSVKTASNGRTIHAIMRIWQS